MEQIPAHIAKALLFALVHTPMSEDKRTMTPQRKEEAWRWVEEHAVPYEEMGN